MMKKYVISVFIAFLSFSSLIAQAHPKSAQFIESKDDIVECLNVVFENPDFRISFSSGNGEIMGWTVPEGAEDITEEEWCYILIDCAEKIFGKNSDRYEVNKEKFMNMIEEMKK